MVSNTLTEDRIIAGKMLVKEADESGFKIDAALWFYFQDLDSWKLMLAIKGLEKNGPKSIYNKLQKILNKLNLKLLLPLSDIALVKPKTPMLDMMKMVVRTSPDDISGIRFTGNVINGQLIPDAYIYRLS